jgi:hypothetical protein
VAFPLEELAPAIADRAGTWARLGFARQTQPIAANHGKPIVISVFESEGWIVQIMVWDTGDAELEALRWADCRMVSKHYELTGRAEFEVLLDEFVALLDDDRVPDRAVIHWP